MEYRILNTFGETYSKEARGILEKLGSVDYKTLTQDEFDNSISEYDFAVIGLGLTFHKETLEKAKKLKAIATATTGLDHIDLEYAEEQGVQIVSLRGEDEFLRTITGTAELAWGLLLSITRSIPEGFEAVKKYEWNREDFRGHILYGKTLGIVGMGRLGTWMARYASAFGMKVIYTDPDVPKSTVEGCKRVDFETLLGESDYISINTHLNNDTENLFDSDTLEKMKKGAYLINTSRGKIVNEQALIEALKKGTIGGYGTDVLSDELEFETKGFTNHPLVEYSKENENVIIVPHIGGMNVETRIKTDVFIAEKLKNIFSK